MIALLLALGCGGGTAASQVDASAEPIGMAECDVCAMVVGEQPSPRAQLVYRDGSHAHTCSIDEARALAASPGAKGRPIAVWVEALPADFDWTVNDTAPLPWTDATAAHYVFGAPRTHVMGVPVLSYAEPALARKVADTLGSTPVTWQDLLETPVPEVPPGAGWTPHGSKP